MLRLLEMSKKLNTVNMENTGNACILLYTVYSGAANPILGTYKHPLKK